MADDRTEHDKHPTECRHGNHGECPYCREHA